MKGIGRGTIQRCDARPLTAPFLLMFHNYYHAINSNGTGGRPLRKRHSYALCVINTRVFLKTLSIVRNRPPPFSLSLCFFSFYKNRKRFPRSLANCPLFSPPSSPVSDTLFPLHARLRRILAFVRSAGSCARQPTLFLLHGFEFFRSRISLLDSRLTVDEVKWREERIRSNVCLANFFFRKKGISFRRFRARICSTFHTRIWKTYKHERIERAFAFFIDGTERGSRDFSNDDADLSPTDGPSIDFPCLYYSTDRLIRNRDIREKLIFTLTSSLSRSTREESWLFLLFFSAPNRFLLDCPFLFFIKNRKPLF